MDYQNRAGSKKGGGGIVSDSQANLARRKQVDELLRHGQEVPYTFQEDRGQNQNEVNRDPYIYKNNSGKLVCKLCSTMHMSWVSVERHLSGKKHGLNVLRRGNATDRTGNVQQPREEHDQQFQAAIEERRNSLKCNGIAPACKIANVKDTKTGNLGITIQADYSQQSQSSFEEDQKKLIPFARIVSGLELPEVEKKDKKFVVIAYEPFVNAAVEIPPDKNIIMGNTYETKDALDEFNRKCTFWDSDSGMFYVQFFFS